MPNSRLETQLTWSSSNSITLAGSSRQDSDVIALNIDTVDMALQIYCDNQGTPASGDVVKAWLKGTAGDVITGGGDDYDTDEHAQFLRQLDTYGSNDPGEDPACVTIPLGQFVGIKALKLSVAAPQAGTRNIVVKARLVEYLRP